MTIKLYKPKRLDSFTV